MSLEYDHERSTGEFKMTPERRAAIDAINEWRRKWTPKPGPSGPICSACGETWPCDYWRCDTCGGTGLINDEHDVDYITCPNCNGTSRP